ncbi:hypothetical protein A1QO_01745 [Vibrio genomosp. F10 str. ZF-129]|uniref:Uncharacterized protein n=1 Tax=Vibrio genomosp. F10 str. ZF-129 TaxID=1187848 RepID=A0A1E5BCR4_9VIBR|nr:hypothetical protein [Vibrio genomosp. F10]OEE32662.1 hypothetical protein A1QO_01745 [Vibrio genomosp. F10 str. ZF-129]
MSLSLGDWAIKNIRESLIVELEAEIQINYAKQFSLVREVTLIGLVFIETNRQLPLAVFLEEWASIETSIQTGFDLMYSTKKDCYLAAFNEIKADPGAFQGLIDAVTCGPA